MKKIVTTTLLAASMALAACSENAQPTAPVVSEAMRQAAFSEFKVQALKLIDASDALADSTVRGLQASQSLAAGYSILKTSRDLQRSFRPLAVPPALTGHAAAAAVQQEVETVIAVRAAAFDYGMDAASDGDQAKFAEMQDRMKRAVTHAAKARLLLSQT